jgi:hypothetical protein
MGAGATALDHFMWKTFIEEKGDRAEGIRIPTSDLHYLHLDFYRREKTNHLPCFLLKLFQEWGQRDGGE